MVGGGDGGVGSERGMAGKGENLGGRRMYEEGDEQGKVGGNETRAQKNERGGDR